MDTVLQLLYIMYQDLQNYILCLNDLQRSSKKYDILLANSQKANKATSTCVVLCCCYGLTIMGRYDLLHRFEPCVVQLPSKDSGTLKLVIPYISNK
jgi:hypothetical protein